MTPYRADRVRDALRAVVDHWPGDMTGLEIQAAPDDPADYGAVRVQIVYRDLGVRYGLRIVFSPSELGLNCRYLRDKIQSGARDMVVLQEDSQTFVNKDLTS